MRSRCLSARVLLGAALVAFVSATSPAHAQSLYLYPGGPNGNTYTAANADYSLIYVGLDSSNNRTDPVTGTPYIATLGVVAGGVIDQVEAFNANVVNVDGGAVTRIFGYDNSVTTIAGGAVDGVSGYDTSLVNVDGGAVSTVNAYNASTVTINGGVPNTVVGYDTSRININGGSMNFVVSTNASVLTLNGGGSATLDIQGFDNGVVNVAGGTVRDIYGFGNSTFNVTGGTVGRILGFFDSVFNISGGTVTDLSGQENVVYNISGGTLGTNTIRAFGNSIWNLRGSGLGLSSGVAGSDSFGNYIEYILSGILQGGQSVDRVRFLDYAGGLSVQDPLAGTGNLRFFGSSAAAPEPGGLCLLGLGLVGFVVVRRYRRAG